MTDRAHFADFALDDQGRPIAGVSVEVRTPGTTTPIADTLYAADDPSGSTLSNPFIAGSDGLIEFYTVNPQRVALYITKSGYQSKTITRDVLRIPQVTTVQDEGSDLTARSKINFKGTTIAAADDAGNGRTNVTLPDYATPAIVLGTAAAPGAAAGVIRPDATIVAFDGTNPVTQAFGDAADPGNVAVAARRNHKHGMPSAPAAAEYDVLDLVTADTDVVNTAAETTLYSFSVPGNTLGTNKTLLLTVLFDYFNNSAATRNFTFRVKYGATTLYDATSPNYSVNTARYPGRVGLWLAADGATNDQYMYGELLLGLAGAPTAGRGLMSASSNPPFSIGGDSAEDSTAAKTLAITIQHPTAHASLSLALRYAQLAVVG